MQSKKIKILNKNFKDPLSCIATYSPAVTKILDGNIDIILVGDSLGTTLYDMNNTQDVTFNMMKKHGKAVIKNIKKSISVIDMPFKTYDSKIQALKNAKSLLSYTNANLIKLEIDEDKLSIIKYLIKKKINIIAHIGITPQNYKDFKKIKIVGKNSLEREKLIQLALNLEKCGVSAILLECVTENTAKLISSKLSIPTIGIGASKNCDGQILVFDDLINLRVISKKPKFVKSYLNFPKLLKIAIKKYDGDIKKRKFPNKNYSYS